MALAKKLNLNDLSECAFEQSVDAPYLSVRFYSCPVSALLPPNCPYGRRTFGVLNTALLNEKIECERGESNPHVLSDTGS